MPMNAIKEKMSSDRKFYLRILRLLRQDKTRFISIQKDRINIIKYTV